MPRSRQSAAPTLAQKAVAYGFPGVQVDGNDVLAVFAATREALATARTGGGPTLIEAFTYRMGDHTTSDDAARYRTKEEVQEWERRDPIARFRLHLGHKKLWDEAYEKEVRRRRVGFRREGRGRSRGQAAGLGGRCLRLHYSSIPPELERQMAELKASLPEGRR